MADWRRAGNTVRQETYKGEWKGKTGGTRGRGEEDGSRRREGGGGDRKSNREIMGIEEQGVR